ncbi:hypothetical protein ACX12E_17035 [Paenibacillus vandeheii]
MSNVSFVFLDGGKQAYISADSRIATIYNNNPSEVYHLHDNAQKLKRYSGGIEAYISGIMDIADVISKNIEVSKMSDILEIAQMSKEIYNAFLLKDPSLKDRKCNVQILIPQYEDDMTWSAIYMDESNDFQPCTWRAEPGKNFVISFGSGYRITERVIERYLGREDIYNVLLKAYTAAADEKCGGVLTCYELKPDGVVMSFTKIPDTRELKRNKDYRPNIIKHGEGDGMTATSGKYIGKKYNGGLSQTYYQSNTGRERSVLLDDSGIITTADQGKYTVRSKEFQFIATENGTYRLSLSNGSSFELTSSGLDIDIQGNINIKATGNIKMNGSRIDLN